jgi:heat shock protein HslJ
VEGIGGRGEVDGVRSTLGFRGDGDGGVYGSGGCNRYNGSITLEAGRLRFGPLASTRRMCPAAVMDQEQRFFEALAQTAGFERRGEFLIAIDTGGADLIRLAPLEGEA